MRPAAWRVALRIARRDALRAKGRSALVAAMIALPVLGVAGADIVYQSGRLDPAERITRQMGSADAEIILWQQGQAMVQLPDPQDGTYPVGLDAKEHRLTPEERTSAATDPAVLVRRLVPAGSTLVPKLGGPQAVASTAHGLARVGTAEMDLADPVWHGIVNVVGGRVPAAPGEVAATRRFLDDSGLHLGDTTTVRGLPRPLTITAAVEYPGALGDSELIGRPGALAAPLARADGGPQGGALSDAGSWLVKVPGGAGFPWEKVVEANRYGFQVTSRQAVLNPPPRSAVPYHRLVRQHEEGTDPVTLASAVTVAGMALLEVVLLAGPAFAVGARRSRRQLGLLAAGGGDRSHVRGVVLGGGVVLGAAGAVAGTALAVAAVAAARPWLEETAGQRFGHVDLHPLDLLAVAALGLATGVLAAVVPAVQASRQDVVAALTGRGTVKPPSRRLAAVGLLAVAGGSALAVLGAAAGRGAPAVVGGSALAELGMVACTPFLVGLFGRLGRHLPLTPRLALRDAVRHRGRTAPAVAAVMAAVAGSVAVGVYTTSQDADARRHYEASAPAGALTLTGIPARADHGAALHRARAAVERAVAGLGPRADVYGAFPADCPPTGGCIAPSLALPPERECPLHGPGRFSEAESARLQRDDPRCRPDRSSWASRFEGVPVGDAAVLRTLFGVHDPAAERALAAGSAVVFDARYVKDGHVTLHITTESAPAPADGQEAPPKERDVRLPAIVRTPSAYTAEAMLPPAAARRAGLRLTEAGSVWQPAAAPSEADVQRAYAAVAPITPDASLDVERGYRSSGTLTTLGLTLFAALVALGAAGIATGLAAADSQQDLATLAAVGAAPRIRRSLSGLQCGVVAAMGALLGTVCGVVPAVALREVEQATMGSLDTVSIVFPWWQLAATVAVLPAVAALLAALLSRSRIALVRRAG
ncbi:FtsX-like permease family protein [Streptacidiphilus sp. ASG 303]|uniref:FtsX-like permease family protein n=1 Tax=Streptacidiphilus sp. ASG 303 TaxID=2896847 RepID=UPI001E373A22|nr:FtsX-like permease family protein [Streptacidiphilus sp. ASG 303]MCD0482818.1 FtsX-like permease family protein [Streptacidiphilus sp. ASG 303]